MFRNNSFVHGSLLGCTQVAEFLTVFRDHLEPILYSMMAPLFDMIQLQGEAIMITLTPNSRMQILQTARDEY
jgi:hypothetical protein